LLQATEGSRHGYDVVDHTRVADDLGGEPARRRLVTALAERGMGLVVDVVPNHMAIGTERNHLWWSLLREGPTGEAAEVFDIDWDPPDAHLRDMILLPVLGDHYGKVLERGELALQAREAEPGGPIEVVVRYGELRFPLAAGTLAAATGTDDWRAALEQAAASVDVLHEVLEAQHYRLAYWRTAGHDLDYRRFFDVTDLAGIRVEDPAVFERTHALIGAWAAAAELDGIRVDHPDGLRDPEQYLERLRALAPDAWLVVEKILEPDEDLPAWPVDGTTGYDALRDIGGLFVDPDGVRPLAELAAELTGEPVAFATVAAEAKRQVVDELFESELRRLTALLAAVAEAERSARDHTKAELRAALVATLVSFGIYRTYVTPGAPATAADRAQIERAIDIAADAEPDADGDLYRFLGLVLAGDVAPEDPTADELRARFQQLTPPVMAKGVEDTALYRHLAVPAANEVGGDPADPARSLATFHAAQATRANRWPSSMVALTTHDTKRSEDARARLSLLSEMPELWAKTLQGWRDATEEHRAEHGPDPLSELLVFQMLVGAHPLGADRAEAHLRKAMREAKRATSWLRPDRAAEDAATGFLAALLTDPAFGAALDAFVSELLVPGRATGLAMKLLQLTVPGVPDLYQGSELWLHTLVDPDNRGPVDFDLRRRLLADLPATAADLPHLRDDHDGRTKLFVTQRALGLRTQHADAFAGGYTPLAASGTAADHAVGFLRRDEVAAIVPRLVWGLIERGGWRDTVLHLPAGEWTDVLGSAGPAGARLPGGDLALAGLLHHVPVALLTRAGP
jgi:(1->4)-alpha-D-glucan 1-alpha-D-glucosylmutase